MFIYAKYIVMVKFLPSFLPAFFATGARVIARVIACKGDAYGERNKRKEGNRKEQAHIAQIASTP